MDVTMPQLGETVTEGTITKWFKQVGEKIDADEPLFEVSTDKVDSEVPAPESGFVTEIVVQEGETVPVGARLAVISADAGGARGRACGRRAGTGSCSRTCARPRPRAAAAAPRGSAPPVPAPAPAPPPAPASAPAPAPAAANGGGVVTSPIVRRLIEEQGLDPAQIRGTGEGGRITRNDVLDAARARGSAPAPAAPRRRRSARGGPSGAAQTAPPAARGVGDEIVPFDNIRRRTAEHMVRSLATSAHVYTSVRVDFERIERVRRAHQAEWTAEEGFALTYLPFITRAFCDVVHDYPHVNASVEGETLVVHRDINLGIAIDLQFKGLDRSCDPQRRRQTSALDRPRDPRPRGAGEVEATRSGRDRRGHVHDHEHGPVRHDADVRDHQPAAGRDHGDRRNPQGTGRRRRPRR